MWWFDLSISSDFSVRDRAGQGANLLEDLWVRIEDLKLAALSRQAAFLRVIAGATAAGFERLFSKRLISSQSWAVSACYSLASLCLLVGYFVRSHDISIARMIREVEPGVIVANALYRAEYGDYLEAWLFTTGLALLALGTFPLIIRSARTRWVWVASVAFSVVLIACVFFWTEYAGWVQYYDNIEFRTLARHTSLLWENLILEPTPELLSRLDFVLTMLVAFWTGIAVGVISDLLFIVATRRTLQWASEISNFFGMVVLIVSNGFLAVVLSLGPAISAYLASAPLSRQKGLSADNTVDPWSIDLLAAGVRQAGYIASLSNGVTAVVALAVLVLASIALMHRLLWPLLARPV